jgi:hypothetical protein
MYVRHRAVESTTDIIVCGADIYITLYMGQCVSLVCVISTVALFIQKSSFHARLSLYVNLAIENQRHIACFYKNISKLCGYVAQ